MFDRVLNTPISHISFFQFKYRYYFETPLKNPAIIINLKPSKSLKVFTCTCDASFFILTSPPFFSNNVKTCSWTKSGLEAIVQIQNSSYQEYTLHFSLQNFCWNSLNLVLSIWLCSIVSPNRDKLSMSFLTIH